MEVGKHNAIGPLPPGAYQPSAGFIVRHLCTALRFDLKKFFTFRLNLHVWFSRKIMTYH